VPGKGEQRLPVLRLPDLRHTSATLLGDGVPVTVVPERLSPVGATIPLAVHRGTGRRRPTGSQRRVGAAPGAEHPAAVTSSAVPAVGRPGVPPLQGHRGEAVCGR
jgi:hypothetical protein